jgi:hypothetical protein
MTSPILRRAYEVARVQSISKKYIDGNVVCNESFSVSIKPWGVDASLSWRTLGGILHSLSGCSTYDKVKSNSYGD